jgi:hypothetical protein
VPASPGQIIGDREEYENPEDDAQDLGGTVAASNLTQRQAIDECMARRHRGRFKEQFKDELPHGWAYTGEDRFDSVRVFDRSATGRAFVRMAGIFDPTPFGKHFSRMIALDIAWNGGLHFPDSLSPHGCRACMQFI